MKKSHPSKEEYAVLTLAWKQETDLRKKSRIAEQVIRGLDGLINVIAHRLTSTFHSCDLEDAIQAGRIGVLDALRLWDPDKSNGCSFSNYASNWIRSKIYDFINKEHFGSVRASQTKRMQARKEGEEAFKACQTQCLSYDSTPTGVESKDISFGDIACAAKGVYNLHGAEELEMLDMRQKIFSKADEILNEQEKMVLFGRMEGKLGTQIAKEANLTRQRINIVEKHLKAKILKTLLPIYEGSVG